VKPARAIRHLAVLALVSAPIVDAAAAGPPLSLQSDPGVDPDVARGVAHAVAELRTVRPPLPLPTATMVSTEEAVRQEREQALQGELQRARDLESMADWDGCVRASANATGEAIELAAAANSFTMLRELHLEVAVCSVLAGRPDDARSHFLAAGLLDETPLPTGSRRSEAEEGFASALAEIAERPRGPVRILTEPPGAEIWIDGARVEGTTPLTATVRLGEHYVTARRFRHETRTDRHLLTPGTELSILLEPARRRALGDQLARDESDLAQGARERRLALAAWSRAEQVLWVSALPLGQTSLVLYDAETGARVRAATLGIDPDDEDVRQAVCRALGESCEPDGGIPWFVWPIAVTAAVGVAVVIGVAVESDRDAQFCAPSGCP
jgi:hypothetical protein